MVYILFNLLQPPHTPLFTHNVLNLAFIPSQSWRNISSKIICWISSAFHNQVIKASADCFIFFQSIINVTIFFILNNENKRYVKLVGKVFSESFVNDYGWEGLVPMITGSRHPEVFLGKAVLKICSKFTGEHHAEVWLCKATLLKSHFGMGVLL